MARKIVAGNWKMNKTKFEAEALFSQIVEFNDEFPAEVEVIISPPALYLWNFSKRTASMANIAVAAQNCHMEQSGAFTGEVSPEMLKSIGVKYCIIGHSERRNLFGETNEMLAQKVNACLQYQLNPIYCCGEVLAERDENRHQEVVKEQLEKGLFFMDEAAFANVVIAYEPVWAIGTGLTATPAQAQEMHAYIRSLVNERYGAEVGAATPILYGGSCKPENANELFACNDVDGGLIGGAALKVNSFVNIIKAAQ